MTEIYLWIYIGQQNQGLALELWQPWHWRKQIKLCHQNQTIHILVSRLIVIVLIVIQIPRQAH